MPRHQAIILKKLPIKEHDELIMCYTRDGGKRKFRAKSSVLPRSKQGSHLDVLSRVEFSVVEGKHASHYPIITSASCIQPYFGIRQSLPAVAVSFFLLEAFDKLVFEDEQDEPLWNFLLTRLAFFNEHAAQPLAFWKEEMTRAHDELLVVLGYGDQTTIRDLSPQPFSSLQFFSRL